MTIFMDSIPAWARSCGWQVQAILYWRHRTEVPPAGKRQRSESSAVPVLRAVDKILRNNRYFDLWSSNL
jgi:hypothetical protein